MPGFSSQAGGGTNDGLGSIMYADNVSFDGNPNNPRSAPITLDGQLLIGSTAAPHIRVGTLVGGTGINITPGSGTITITNTAPASGAITMINGNNISITGSPVSLGGSVTIATVSSGWGLQWFTTPGAAVTMFPNRGYVLYAGSLTNMSLPTTAVLNDIVSVINYTGASFKITQAANQFIHIGSSTSTVGATGFIQSTANFNSVTLICVAVSGGVSIEWAALSTQGNITVS